MRPEKQYNLGEIYARESKLERYIRLTVGQDASIPALVWNELVLGLCTGLPGALGLALRSNLYPFLSKGLKKSAHIGRHVTLRCPRQIELGPGVIIDEFTQLIATSGQKNAISIGDGSFVRSFAMINAGPPEGFIHIGKHSSIGQAALLYGSGGLTIGDNVMIAGHSSIIASSHNFSDLTCPMSEQGFNTQGITIKNNVWIGTGARILDGVTIHEGAIIGANAVVTSSIGPGEIVGGIPARPLKPGRYAG